MCYLWRREKEGPVEEMRSIGGRGAKPANACTPAFAEAFGIARSRMLVSRLPVLVLRWHYAYTQVGSFSCYSRVFLSPPQLPSQRRASLRTGGQREPFKASIGVTMYGTFKIAFSMRLRHSKALSYLRYVRHDQSVPNAFVFFPHLPRPLHRGRTETRSRLS